MKKFCTWKLYVQKIVYDFTSVSFFYYSVIGYHRLGLWLEMAYIYLTLCVLAQCSAAGQWPTVSLQSTYSRAVHQSCSHRGCAFFPCQLLRFGDWFLWSVRSLQARSGSQLPWPPSDPGGGGMYLLHGSLLLLLESSVAVTWEWLA